MSKRQGVSSSFKQPAKVQKTGSGKEKASAVPVLSEVTIKLPPSSSSGPTPAVSSIIQASKSESKENLRLSDANFKILSQFISNLESLHRCRRSIIKTHESIVKAVNSGDTPPVTRIPVPRPPHGHDFSSEFLKLYQEKAHEYSVHLSVLLLPEYKNLVTKLTSDIEFEIHEGESALSTIEDEVERGKAIQLFNIKQKNIARRFTEERKTFKIRRHHQR